MEELGNSRGIKKTSKDLAVLLFSLSETSKSRPDLLYLWIMSLLVFNNVCIHVILVLKLKNCFFNLLPAVMSVATISLCIFRIFYSVLYFANVPVVNLSYAYRLLSCLACSLRLYCYLFQVSLRQPCCCQDWASRVFLLGCSRKPTSGTFLESTLNHNKCL